MIISLPISGLCVARRRLLLDVVIRLHMVRCINRPPLEVTSQLVVVSIQVVVQVEVEAVVYVEQVVGSSIIVRCIRVLIRRINSIRQLLRKLLLL